MSTSFGGKVDDEGSSEQGCRGTLPVFQRELAQVQRAQTDGIGREAQYRTMESPARHCVEPVVFESGRVNRLGTAEKLREWLLLGALAGPEMLVGQQLVFDCEILVINPHVAPVRVKAPAGSATVDALRDIGGRYRGTGNDAVFSGGRGWRGNYGCFTDRLYRPATTCGCIFG